MAVTTTSTFTGATTPTVPGSVLKLFIAAARMTPQLPGNLTTLVQNDPLPNGMGTTWNSPKFGTYTAYSLTQGVDMSQQQDLSTTNIVITPAEVGVQAVFTWKSLAQWSENVISRAGEIMRRAMDRKKDTDISGLFTGLDRAMGAAAQTMSVGHLTAAVSALAGGSTGTADAAITVGTGTNVVEEGPFYGAFRPEQLHRLSQAILGGGGYHVSTPSTSAATSMQASIGLSGGPGSLQNEIGRNGVLALFHGEIAGVQLYRSANIARDTNNDAIGAVFVKGAMVYVPMEYKGTGDDMIEDDKSLRASELNYVEDYGFGELDGNLGCKVTTDSSPNTA